MLETSRAKALTCQIDSMIERYGSENPQLLLDLQAHKAALEEAARKGTAKELMNVMYRVATWVRFIMDHLPDS